MKEVVAQCSKFLSSPSHAAIGLKLLSCIVSEFNELQPGTTLSAHRKLSVSFRDRSLLQVFQMALTAHRQVLDGNVQNPQREAILAGALELSHKCLCFDFIGTQPSERTEEGGAVQVPNNWREVFESEGVLRLFFSVYRLIISCTYLCSCCVQNDYAQHGETCASVFDSSCICSPFCVYRQP